MSAKLICWDADVDRVFAHVRLVCDKKDAGILMVQDTKTNEWMLPGGMVEKHESAHHAIVREMKEEVGVIDGGGHFESMFIKPVVTQGQSVVGKNLQVFNMALHTGDQKTWDQLLRGFKQRTRKRETKNASSLDRSLTRSLRDAKVPNQTDRLSERGREGGREEHERESRERGSE